MGLLECKGIVKRFGGLYALRGVDLSVNEKEIMGIIGPNGSGKTTLFNVISGTFPPTAGIVKFRDMNITGLKPHEICRLGIARTFQIPKPFPRMTVYENVFAAAFFGRSDRRDRSSIEKDVENILWRVGLSTKSSAPALSLTVFEQRMLEVARALSTRPKLLLLDEVMAGLNPKETADCAKLIQGLREEGITIIIIEHNMRAVMGLSDRVIVLNEGMKIAEGEPKEVCRDLNVIRAYLGEDYVGS
ncbi:MAG: ABC transporter ATP-binding protein [Candidatus Bathyarchaeia archaeon]